VAHITIDDDQARIIARATEMVELRDREGRLLGYATHGLTEEDIAVARQRLASCEPGITTQQLLGRLRSLECP
jgi:uncharacterized membrane protein affecting hemolysin expression